ncbi:MAG: DEAD/DEAH box helicase [Treponemataceae bacterium]|nr:DEAD/DEAH box helicase [Treponemataceae bacterium]
MNFVECNLDERLLQGISAAGYTVCTPVQEQVLKIAQDGSDVYVQSQTGTGKTAAYLVAVIQEMLSGGAEKKKALVMVPTRELAVQVEEEAKTLCGPAGLKAFSFYGGVGYERQIAALKDGVDIIIGTPGRLIDLQEGRSLDLSEVGFLVIDEADRMFDMGFYPDLRKLLKVLPESERRQTMLFSATLNSYVKNLAWEYTRDAKEIEIEAENITVSEIDQELLHVSSDEKMKLLIGILKKEEPSSVIIFCNTKRGCEVVAKRLCMNGIESGFIIGDLPQSRRLQILTDFKEGRLSVLVATDVAARGIDVDALAMVINFDLPNEAENYVHRIGRTARAGKTGKSYTFCSEQDVYNLPAIERYIEMQIPSRVADPSMMIEDKSAGVYIRTEDWREDGDGGRGGFREGRSSRNCARPDGGRDGRRGGKRRSGSGSYAADGRSGTERQGRDFKKSGNGRDGGRKRSSEKPRTSGAHFAEMANLSFEDRMKVYKEKYSGGRTAQKGGRSESRGAANAGGARPPRKDGRIVKGGYGEYGRSSGKKKKAQAANGAVRTSGSPSGARRPEQKKGLVSRIKSFFGR